MSMTMAETILARASGRDRVAAKEFVTACPDKVIAHEALALVAKSLKEAGIDRVRNPERIIVALDHYVPAPTIRAAMIHQAVRKAVKDYGINHYYGINGGVVHQVVVDRGLVSPGELVVGTDSHTCTYGALGAAACGVGPSEAAYVMATGKLWLRVPETIRIVLDGTLNDLVTPKDVILKIAGDYSAELAQYKSVEFTGPGASEMSISGRLTMSNMAVEIGAKFGFFFPDSKTWELWGHEGPQPDFSQDAPVSAVYRVNLSVIEPMVAKPHSVDCVASASQLSDTEVHQAFLGSCTNGRMEDLRLAVRVMAGRRVHAATRLLVAPASWAIYRQAMKEGILEQFLACGAVVLNPGCGPCFGGHMGLLAPGENCISSTNRNFKGRMGSKDAGIYLGSPATVAASAVTGRITDPREV